jgi:hypothetical protein
MGGPRTGFYAKSMALPCIVFIYITVCITMYDNIIAAGLLSCAMIVFLNFILINLYYHYLLLMLLYIFVGN